MANEKMKEERKKKKFKGKLLVLLLEVVLNHLDEHIESSLLKESDDPAHWVGLEGDAEGNQELCIGGLLNLTNEIQGFGLIAASAFHNLPLL